MKSAAVGLLLKKIYSRIRIEDQVLKGPTYIHSILTLLWIKQCPLIFGHY